PLTVLDGRPDTADLVHHRVTGALIACYRIAARIVVFHGRRTLPASHQPLIQDKHIQFNYTIRRGHWGACGESRRPPESGAWRRTEGGRGRPSAGWGGQLSWRESRREKKPATDRRCG